MKLSSPNFSDGAPVPGTNAFCVPDPANHVTLAPNRNPALAWSDLPAGTKSLVLLCHDPDVPTRPDDVNQEGRVVPSDLPRFDFFHWVLVDIPPTAGGIAEGSHADGVTPRGKPGPDAPGGMRHGLVDEIGGLWDGMLAEGRKFFFFASSDDHKSWRQGGSDFWPGEYQKQYTYIDTQADDPIQAVFDGVKSGHSWNVQGDLIDELEILLL